MTKDQLNKQTFIIFAGLSKEMIRKLLITLSVFVIITVAAAVWLYKSLYGPSIRPGNEKAVILLPAGSDYDSVLDSLSATLIIKNRGMLDWVARKKKYPSQIKPGRYVIDKPVSCVALINLLRSGRQTPVKITFNNIRTIGELAGKIGGTIEADSASIIDFFSDNRNYEKDGFKKETILSVFIPDTYEFFWNTGPEGFYTRMLKEYRRFWNEERIAKAGEKGLSPAEVSVLASIVDAEALLSTEKARIAGVYINRLNRGIPLQADPTVIFACNDFSITRVLHKHLDIDSPYNTYKYKGLPPGPIGCPSIGGIEAVLNAEKHDYIYFVAKADFSGYHTFSRTLSEHNRNAALFQSELNKRRIYK